jgi:probable rRNA maturation factor
MASQVQVTNRQRRLKLDSKWFKGAAEELFEAVLDNVKKRPPEFLSEEEIDNLQDFGILSVVVVSNREIQKLNKQWRGKDYATDVLSFPLDLAVNEDGVPFEMGELIISAEKAQEQAEEYGHSFEREMAFLFVHGCLHVLGFDHLTKAEEKEMFSRQKQILDSCGFKR